MAFQGQSPYGTLSQPKSPGTNQSAPAPYGAQPTTTQPQPPPQNGAGASAYSMGRSGIGASPLTTLSHGAGVTPLGPNYSPIAAQTGAGVAPAQGTDSGPGILQQWFAERATGSDPGYQYAMQRGNQAIADAASARGGFNSSATNQQLSDFAANMGAQREAQLDSLAGGASGERQGAINSMLSSGLGLAGGEAGTMSGYDTAAANALNAITQAMGALGGAKAGAIQQGNQGFLSNLGI